ncbi:hypothetical protein [Haloferax volcanii]|uniref:Uncharacterized protein n=3 Tax=Haloferax volcanii TaxID=2246 RepID=A0A384LN31_HALVD|nr:hypothetical protein [Haloferax volcanii]ADE02899.1 uncharacterized protein HVO_1865 [Haloferax volcanii DS2]ELY34759.1 hypothetical protein C498_04595 [Haloferax volcanii DS2]MBS8120038.1 hypothetical protein [Haloferax volcanii]MBS8125076.1 hypothetical protein [Haloferax volcanii]MBS8128573.1 hypothetical protein [Haloferax volcanii]
MRLVTVETVTLIVVGWVLALGAMLVRHRRDEVDRRTVFNWALAACSSVGWALWQFDTLPATADTPIGAAAPWLATLLGLVGAAVAVHLYRTRPRAEARESEPTPEADEAGTEQS